MTAIKLLTEKDCIVTYLGETYLYFSNIKSADELLRFHILKPIETTVKIYHFTHK